ncbi:glycosyltransferase family 2 protein [Candidatus Nomurabacteria bacterium]|nr:glycosyltransferase family 2 protein [Candidatus Nomurabacteria bacterium]
MNDKLTILVSIPAKNEALTVSEVVNGCRQVISDKYQLKADILVISDGSTDDTAHRAEVAGATVIRHDVSRGLGTIFQEAVDYAIEKKYDLMVTIDGDRQFDETEIPLLLDPIIDGQADFCSGNRFASQDAIPNMSSTKRIGNKIVARMVNYILNDNYTDVSCGYRAYSREALLHLNLFGGFTYTQEVFLNLGFKGIKIKEIPISVTYFPERKSRIARSIFRYGTQVLKIILSSLIFYKPMKFFGTLAILSWIFAIPTSIILGLRYFETGLISPYKALGISALAAFGIGVILLAVGVILYSLSRQQLSIDKLHYYAKRR